MSVITISRHYGSGGNEIAALICQSTGYKLFDKHVLSQAAFESGLANQETFDFCEDDYHTKNFFARLFGVSRPVAQVHVWKDNSSGERVAIEQKLNEEQALGCVRRAIQKAYEMEDFVIVGRGGQVVLRGQPGVLHVRVLCPLEERILRVRNSPEMAGHAYADSVEARRAAQALIESHDEASSSYLKRFYGMDWSDPALYHVIINTGMMPVETAARVIIEAARALQTEIT